MYAHSVPELDFLCIHIELQAVLQIMPRLKKYLRASRKNEMFSRLCVFSHWLILHRTMPRGVNAFEVILGVFLALWTHRKLSAKKLSKKFPIVSKDNIQRAVTVSASYYTEFWQNHVRASSHRPLLTPLGLCCAFIPSLLCFSDSKLYLSSCLTSGD